MNMKTLDTGKVIVTLTKQEIRDAVRFYCTLASVHVPKEAKLYKLGAYAEMTGGQFEFSVNGSDTDT